MKGKKRVIIQNNRVHYEFVIKRNITIIQGDSASGKTTLVNMIRQAENLGESSGINVSCEVPCRVLEGVNWKIILENSRESIFFIDEENYFIKTEEFASAIRGSENYFVLITRENLYNLPYSMFPENTEIPEKYIRKCIRSIPKQHGFLLEYKK